MNITLKQISEIAMFVLLVLLVLACNTLTEIGLNTEQLSASEAIADELPPAPNIKEVAAFDLKPGGCDMVCVLGAYLGLND